MLLLGDVEVDQQRSDQAVIALSEALDYKCPHPARW